MTPDEKKVLQKLEGEYWLNLCEAHYDFMKRNGTFDSFDLYNEALLNDKRHFYWLIKWGEISHLLKKFNIEDDRETHLKALEITQNDPIPYNF